eukprot:4631833-Amphidinium_carterae.1
MWKAGATEQVVAHGLIACGAGAAMGFLCLTWLAITVDQVPGMSECGMRTGNYTSINLNVLYIRQRNAEGLAARVLGLSGM